MMVHRREHPLAGRVVVPDSGLACGERVYVVDWVDRIPAIDPDGVLCDVSAVLVHDDTGQRHIPAHDLPSYDPQPLGFVS